MVERGSESESERSAWLFAKNDGDVDVGVKVERLMFGLWQWLPDQGGW